MQQNWFEIKVGYTKIDQGGYERKCTDNYLVDAVSFTDAESRIFEIMKEITRGDFNVKNIKRSNITEVISKNDGEWWYKAKISLVAIDEEAGKEKKFTQYILVMGNDPEDTLKQLEDGLSYLLVPYVVTGVQLSTIADVFPYIVTTGFAKLEEPEEPEEILDYIERTQKSKSEEQ